MSAATQTAKEVLVWEYPAGENEPYVLRAGTAERGWLRFEEDPAACSTAEIEGGRWSLRRTGDIHPHVTAYSGDAPDPVAEFIPARRGGGVLNFAGGPRFGLKRGNIWGTKWCFHREGEGKGCSVCLSQEAGPLRTGATIQVCPDAARLPETQLLVVLAWYLRVLNFQLESENIGDVV
jgi:hypothetical protein